MKITVKIVSARAIFTLCLIPYIYSTSIHESFTFLIRVALASYSLACACVIVLIYNKSKYNFLKVSLLMEFLLLLLILYFIIFGIASSSLKIGETYSLSNLVCKTSADSYLAFGWLFIISVISLLQITIIVIILITSHISSLHKDQQNPQMITQEDDVFVKPGERPLNNLTVSKNSKVNKLNTSQVANKEKFQVKVTEVSCLEEFKQENKSLKPQIEPKGAQSRLGEKSNEDSAKVNETYTIYQTNKDFKNELREKDFIVEPGKKNREESKSIGYEIESGSKIDDLRIHRVRTKEKSILRHPDKRGTNKKRSVKFTQDFKSENLEDTQKILDLIEIDLNKNDRSEMSGITAEMERSYSENESNRENRNEKPKQFYESSIDRSESNDSNDSSDSSDSSDNSESSYDSDSNQESSDNSDDNSESDSSKSMDKE